MSSPRSLQQLLAGFGVPAPDLEVTGVEMDSRRISPGDLFLACRGRGTHGLMYLDQARERGAAAVAWEPAPGWSAPEGDLPEIAVPELSARVGEIAARFYGRPSERMFCVGITGTDGKTSTAYLTAQALDRLKLPCAYIGTIGIGRIGSLRATSHTTPDPVSLQRAVAELREQGAQALAMEVSSHALDQERVSGMHFDVAVLTNITRDHLDYHGTVERYAAAKRRLFERPELSARVLNRDDAWGARWLAELPAGVETILYGLDGNVPPSTRHVIGRDLVLTPGGIDLTLDTSWGRARLQSRLLGRFNAYNLLAVVAVLMARGVALDAAVDALAQAQTVPGRIEGFRGPLAQPLVVVDYAHTPDALRQILSAVRAHTPGRLICVFGCGGDRDRGKRPLMGAVAAELADAVIVTDDNPRSEDPAAIVRDILAGVPGDARAPVTVIHDRAAAIRAAVGTAGRDDVVVVAGKGHEQTQTYGSDVRPFSDRAFVAALVGAAGAQS
ncbi:UDP-N-acetylmuramoylalanyl-D-glutamate--2,6-diaminopimelate ligase [Fontimonas thermophila]|uniref:UDP-N-acetylmuramoyl-L-alanyl-D-glutamate--2,6-diaminopimelate ligase n=1 Tax=Fontimonas thermophila TaxID=1076937 RepID=A0A1I2K7D9_9GAMM|nr:UDP-N-acetylmuramoyl-L-alanyl-D-glutamate--2,6-diaminopimelate ligase [Fontimonas thermophila]SFF61107.1 UDP-N-acetylmuramoylalanyl-D-glutamate--2,6-diaminopimelate ligase [Fontimonas thermophila]